MYILDKIQLPAGRHFFWATTNLKLSRATMRRRRPHLPPSLPAAPPTQCPHHRTAALPMTRLSISPAGGAPLPPPAPSRPAAAEVHRRRFRGLASTAVTAPPLHDALTPAAPLHHRYPPRAERGRRSRRSRPFATPPHITIRRSSRGLHSSSHPTDGPLRLPQID